MADIIPTRSEIPEKYTWNGASVFASPAELETEVAGILDAIEGLSGFKNRLAEGPTVLLEALAARDAVGARASKALIYAAISYYVDTTNQAAAEMLGKVHAMLGVLGKAGAFYEPELLSLGQETLQAWMNSEPRLKPYEHYLDNLFRTARHIRSVEVEELLGMLSDPFSSTTLTASMLTDSDFTYPPATASTGEKVPVSDAALEKILAGPDREARRTAYDSYTGVYLAFKNTLANNLATSIKQNVFTSRARQHESTLDASLFKNNVPLEVFHNLIDTFRNNLPTWHRYWAIRRKALGVDQLYPYDIWAPIAKDGPKVGFEQAVDWICAGLAPMGDEYVETMRRGCLEERWIDVYPNQGKVAGAFSYGTQGTHPFIVTSYDGTIFAVSRLAHELGHSMHSYHIWKTQPPIYSDYSLFIAEVASNFHQAMVRGYLLNTTTDTNLQLALIEEAMDNFHRYFFIMPTLARFELEIHQMVERGEGLTADKMNNLMADLFAEAYGDEMQFDRQRVGITWATFAHLYSDYYVYQYATGISGANLLASQILAGEPSAVENYLAFLRAGSSLYPLDALKLAGVDLTTPAPVEATFKVLSDLVDRLEKLVGG